MQLLCLVLFGLLLAAATSHLRRPPPLEQAKGQRYWYCAECGLEMTIPADRADKPIACPHCGPGKQMAVHSFSINNGERPALALNRPFLALIFGVPILLAVGLYAANRARRQKPRTDADQEVFRFRCPACSHEIESNSYRKGSTAVCPACAELFVVTKAVSDPEDLVESEQAQELEDGIRSKLRKKRFGPKGRRSV
jgi:DNA-directed RNA polymerase subunit RPC12/RpoP